METKEIELPAQEADVLARIKDVLKARPTYGYRRVTAILNAKRYQE